MKNIVEYKAKKYYHINFKAVYLVITTAKTEQQNEWIRKYMCNILVTVTLHVRMSQFNKYRLLNEVILYETDTKIVQQLR